jgi:dipeptidyl aminopeptidase/acylaminoacyl peptidase
MSRSTAQDGSSPHKFLYFPDENHWVLAPNHVKIWYSTVFAFLAHHLQGEDWKRPALLEY